ncbi:MAG: alpha-L-fucosidase [Candidatus Hydrogenedentes bacterium]|nr:alpha-L-fucosidase [Candidatus Hydrogenedentota bacterium]
MTAVVLCGAGALAGAAERAYLHAAQEDMAWWTEARFGLFVHWGPVSLKGTEIGWSRGGERRGTGGSGPIPAEEYDRLYESFNPVEFDADEWVAIAQAAGMKYIVFTTKHHDGFCMFDTALSEYKITNSPFGRDVVAELAEACHKAGMRLGFYYSPPDWHHPDYRTERHAQYVAYLHGQLRELCTNYGQVDVIWFDGLAGTAADWDSDDLFKMIRELQPGVLINNRAGLKADFDTPEQRVGAFQNDRPWESCITICRQWAWKPDDTMKSLEECLHTLIRCAGGDGNLLFNVGPMPSGAIEPRQVERLKEMGAWLEQYGGTIYGTRGGPYRPCDWCASTCTGNVAYLHLLAPAGNEVVLPGLGARVVSSRLLTGGEVEVSQAEDGLTLSLAPALPHAIDTIVELTLDRPAGEVAPVFVSASLTAGKPATASNVYQGMKEYTADKAVDGNSASRWATDGGTYAAWLAIDLGKEVTFDRMTIDEACGTRVESYELQRRGDDGGWETVLTGGRIGPAFSREFEPITAREVRLNILKASEGPTLNEFDLYPVRGK